MLRSTNGLVLGNGRRMNANKLEHYLTWLDDCDKDKAKRLLYLGLSTVYRTNRMYGTVIRVPYCTGGYLVI